jgi:hypothetical protein
MKVKEKMGDGRGRPRKYARGEMQYRKLWLPENLLMGCEWRKGQNFTTNDEIISRLIASLNFSPRRHIIKTDEGQRLVALARLFDEFLQARLDVIRKKYQAEKISDNGKKHLSRKEPRIQQQFPGEFTPGYGSQRPV